MVDAPALRPVPDQSPAPTAGELKWAVGTLTGGLFAARRAKPDLLSEASACQIARSLLSLFEYLHCVLHDGPAPDPAALDPFLNPEDR